MWTTAYTSGKIYSFISEIFIEKPVCRTPQFSGWGEFGYSMEGESCGSVIASWSIVLRMIKRIMQWVGSVGIIAIIG